MKKFGSMFLAAVLALAVMPLQVGAADMEAVPIQDGETVVGSPSKDFPEVYPEVYTVTVTNAGEMTLNLSTDGSANIEVKSEAGKPVAPIRHAENWHIGSEKGYYYVNVLSGREEVYFIYNVKPGNYIITLSPHTYSSTALISTELKVTLPLAAEATATPNHSTVLVDGKEVAFDAYTINQNNYFKLRDLAQVLNGSDKEFEVTWDGEANAITMTSGQSYTSVGGELAAGDGLKKTTTLSTSTIYLDKAPVQLAAYTINGNNYFKLRDIGQALNFDVSWNGLANTIVIDTTKDYTPD